MKRTFDALIIGAGPAGSVAAELLAREGARVCLFDGRPAGEPKACGGGVTSKALKRYPHLLHAAAHIVDQVEMYSPSGRGVNLKLSDPFAILSRAELDSYLRDRAARAGATIVRSRARAETESAGGVKGWTARTADGEAWSGRVLVGADGANSPVARALSGALPRDEMEVAFGYRAPLGSRARQPTLIAFLDGWQGYAWAFPRLDHVSFGIATGQETFDRAKLDALMRSMMSVYDDYCRTKRAEIWREWQQKKETNGGAGGSLTASAKRYAARIPCPSAKTWGTRRAAGDDWALLGDAAGFADPVTGEGIYYALRSGELFAEAFLAGSVASYEERWRADFGDELLRASRLRGRFYGEFAGGAFTDRMISLARLHRRTRRTLGELISGEQGYVNLKSRLLRELPLL